MKLSVKSKRKFPRRCAGIVFQPDAATVVDTEELGEARVAALKADPLLEVKTAREEKAKEEKAKD